MPMPNTATKKPTDLKEVSLAEKFTPLIAAYSREPRVHVEVNNRLDTSDCAYATKTPNSHQYEDSGEVRVRLTNQLVPKGLRGDEEIVDIFLKGEAAHEAGHIQYSRSKVSAENWLIANRYRAELVREISNIVDDAWINWRLKIAFNTDPLARTFDIVKETLSRAWYNHLAHEPTNPQNVLSAIWLYTLYDRKPKQLKGEALKIAESCRKITTNISIMAMANTNSKFSGSYWRDNVVIPIYQLVKPFYQGQSGMPKQVHGSGYGEGDGEGETLDNSRQIDISEDIAEALGEVIDLDKMAEEKKARDEKQGKDAGKGKGGHIGEDSQGGHGFGKGTGREIKPLKADRSAYLKLVHRNTKPINELLRKLPQLTKPQLVVEEFQRHGRLMSQMMGRIFTQSLVAEVPNVYELATTRNERTRVKMGLIVDFSGSMNTEDSRNGIAIISEVLYRWIPSSDFGIFAFGSEFTRVKTFDESYDTTRFRLGGTVQMGGTELGTPLRSMIRAMDSLGTDDPRVIVIFTDMAVDDISAEVAEANRLGIKLMVLGPFYQGSERFGLRKEQMQAVNDLEKLPDAFVKVYSKLGLGATEQRGAAPMVYGQR